MLPPLAVGLWSVNAVLDTAGQLAFKAAAAEPHAFEGLAHWRRMACRPWLWLGIACFVFEFIAWLAFLSLVPLAEGVLLGMINIVAVMLGGRICFGERLSVLRVTGILLIVCGVAVVGGG